MKILCDVCEAAAAVVFCAADEAALCDACDEKVHGCNKLASRHVRLELAESRAVPKCDICESAPAFFFCSVDGTSLCLQCDLDVHIGGKKAHERFLLMAQRVELPKAAAAATQGDGRPNGAREQHGDMDHLDDMARPRPDDIANDRHPPSSTAATAPGQDSLAATKERHARQRSALKAGSDAPAVAIAVGDEVEGALAADMQLDGDMPMAAETPGDADMADEPHLRENRMPPPAERSGGGGPHSHAQGLEPQDLRTAKGGEKDSPHLNLNASPSRSPQVTNTQASLRYRTQVPCTGAGDSGPQSWTRRTHSS